MKIATELPNVETLRHLGTTEPDEIPNDSTFSQLEISASYKNQGNQFGALQNLQNLSNIIVFQNYETFNNLAHGQFMEWLKKIEFSQTVANQFMKVSKNIKQPTSVDLGINALYLIATLPEEE